MLGMHGSAAANYAMQSADVIIALGARFDDRVTLNLAKFAPMAKAAAVNGTGGIVQFEILPKNINKVVEATHVVLGDCKGNLAELLPHVIFHERKPWLQEVQAWKARHPFRYKKPGVRKLVHFFTLFPSTLKSILMFFHWLNLERRAIEASASD